MICKSSIRNYNDYIDIGDFLMIFSTYRPTSSAY